MKHLITCLALGIAFAAGAQTEDPIIFPFNPDANYDGIIGVDDLLAMLSGYGEEVSLPEYTEWATDAVLNLLEMEAELQEELDSLNDEWAALESAQFALDSLSNEMDAVVQSAILEQVTNWCGVYMPTTTFHTIPAGCKMAYIYAQDFNAGGGTLRLPNEGYVEGDILTVVMGQNSIYAGNWSIQRYNNDAWQPLSSCCGDSAGWWPTGYVYLMARNFQFNGTTWTNM